MPEKCPKCGGQVLTCWPTRPFHGRLVIDTSREQPYCYDLGCGWEGEPVPVNQ